jgi:predicted enzyme related to lactoylglutathione lyase
MCGSNFKPSQRRKIMIDRIKHVSIPVKDQDRALAFYTGKLGFEVTTDQSFGGGQRWIEMRIPGGGAGVVLFTPPSHEDRIGTMSNIVFTSDDLEATYRELVERGVEFAQPLKKEPWGMSSIFIDSEGNQFALTSPK